MLPKVYLESKQLFLYHQDYYYFSFDDVGEVFQKFNVELGIVGEVGPLRALMLNLAG